MNYVRQIRSFQPNARRLLVASLLSGLGSSVFSLLFNLYLLSLGHRADFMGLVASTTTLATALSGPAIVLLAPRMSFGRMLALGFLLQVVGGAGMVLSTAPAVILTMAAVLGLSAGFYWAPVPPFLVENSSLEERNHLFAINVAILLVAGILGNLMGGQLPSLLGPLLGTQGPDSYRVTMLVAAAIAGLALLPMSGLRPPASQPHVRAAASQASPSAERAGRRHIAALGLSAITAGVAIGLSFPFFNVFFATQHGASSELIGRIFAINSAVSTVAALAAPALAHRLGYVRSISLGRASTGVALVALAASPSLLLASATLFIRTFCIQTMSPLIDAFSMSIVSPRQRALMASTTTTLWHLGYAVSSFLAGVVIVRYGFFPAFVAAAGVLLLNAGVFLAYFRNWRSTEGS